MRANGRAVRSYEIPALSQVWETMKDWVRSTFTPEKKAEVILTVGTLILIGYFAFVSYQGLQHYTIAGFGNSLSFGLGHLKSAPLFGG
jgi:hypothetical protein